MIATTRQKHLVVHRSGLRLLHLKHGLVLVGRLRLLSLEKHGFFVILYERDSDIGVGHRPESEESCVVFAFLDLVMATLHDHTLGVLHSAVFRAVASLNDVRTSPRSLCRATDERTTSPDFLPLSILVLPIREDFIFVKSRDRFLLHC